MGRKLCSNCWAREPENSSHIRIGEKFFCIDCFPRDGMSWCTSCRTGAHPDELVKAGAWSLCRTCADTKKCSECGDLWQFDHLIVKGRYYCKRCGNLPPVRRMKAEEERSIRNVLWVIIGILACVVMWKPSILWFIVITGFVLVVGLAYFNVAIGAIAALFGLAFRRR